MARAAKRRADPPTEAPATAPEPVGAPVAADPPSAPVSAPRYVARCRIFAGAGAQYAPGDELPPEVAQDGLTAGLHYDLRE